MLDYGRDWLELQRISAYVEEENQVSVHLLEKLGFQRQLEFLCRVSGRKKQMYRYEKRLE